MCLRAYAKSKKEEESQEEDASKLIQYYATLFSNRASRYCQENEIEETKKEEVAFYISYI